MRAPSSTTVDRAAVKLLDGMRDGTVQNRSGEQCKQSTIRRYELALTKHIRPVLGKRTLSALDRASVKALARDWIRSGMVASSIRNNLDPLRVIVREAIEDERLTVDPINGMRLPQAGGRRERVADRSEAQALIAALPPGERALWAAPSWRLIGRCENAG
jgi:site-specific recombinase XerC